MAGSQVSSVFLLYPCLYAGTMPTQLLPRIHNAGHSKKKHAQVGMDFSAFSWAFLGLVALVTSNDEKGGGGHGQVTADKNHRV